MPVLLEPHSASGDFVGVKAAAAAFEGSRADLSAADTASAGDCIPDDASAGLSAQPTIPGDKRGDAASVEWSVEDLSDNQCTGGSVEDENADECSSPVTREDEDAPCEGLSESQVVLLESDVALGKEPVQEPGPEIAGGDQLGEGSKGSAAGFESWTSFADEDAYIEKCGEQNAQESCTSSETASVEGEEQGSLTVMHSDRPKVGFQMNAAGPESEMVCKLPLEGPVVDCHGHEHADPSALDESAHRDSNLPEELQCSICFGAMCQPLRLECKHAFCRMCLLSWTESDCSEQRGCPLCRKEITLADIFTHEIDKELDEAIKGILSPEQYAQRVEEALQKLNELKKQKEEGSGSGRYRRLRLHLSSRSPSSRQSNVTGELAEMPLFLPPAGTTIAVGERITLELKDLVHRIMVQRLQSAPQIFMIADQPSNGIVALVERCKTLRRGVGYKVVVRGLEEVSIEQVRHEPAASVQIPYARCLVTSEEGRRTMSTFRAYLWTHDSPPGIVDLLPEERRYCLSPSCSIS